MREASGIERERLPREDDRKEPAVLPRPHSHLNECATGPYRCEAQRRQQRAVVAVADDLLERRGGHLVLRCVRRPRASSAEGAYNGARTPL